MMIVDDLIIGNDAIMTAWFALCASSDVSTTLETVKSLRSHPAFKSTNANYLRFAESLFFAKL